MALREQPAKSTITNEQIAVFAIELQREQRDIEEATATRTAAVGRKRAILKRAKAAGANNEQLLKAIAAKNADPDEVLKDERDYIRYTNVLVPGAPLKQSDLFADLDLGALKPKVATELKLADAEEQGYRSGLDNIGKEDNPFAQGTPAAGKWLEGWVLGQAQLAPAEEEQEEDKPKQASSSRDKKRGLSVVPAPEGRDPFFDASPPPNGSGAAA